MNKKSKLMVLALMVVVVLLVNGCDFIVGHSAKSLNLDVASDGLGGILAVVEDGHDGYGQRIDAEGNLRWGDGVELNTIHCWHRPN